MIAIQSEGLSVTAHVFACTKCGAGNDLFVIPPKQIFVCTHCSKKSKMTKVLLSSPSTAFGGAGMWAVLLGAVLSAGMVYALSLKKKKELEQFQQKQLKKNKPKKQKHENKKRSNGG